MSTANWIQLLAFIALCVISTPLLGNYMWKVYRGGKAPGDRLFLPVENAIYRLCGVDPEGEQRWNIYTLSLLAFSLAGVLLSYLFLRIQGHLPFNPDHMKGVPPALSFNTAISFVTNTNWQTYGGESTMTHLSQMFALVVQHFLSAAIGMTVAVAFIRALIRRRSTTMGSFWVDVVRSTTRVLLPISLRLRVRVHEPGRDRELPREQDGHHGREPDEPIHGSGVADSDRPRWTGREPGLDRGAGRQRRRFHECERRTPVREPEPDHQRALVLAGRDDPVRVPVDVREDGRSMGQGMVVLASMVVLFSRRFSSRRRSRRTGTTSIPPASRRPRRRPTSAATSKARTRLGIGGSTLGAASITATSAGANNSAHESYMPLGGAIVLTNILLGEVRPGRHRIGAVRQADPRPLVGVHRGLMVGRTPEYLGKKIQSADVKLVTLYLLAVPTFVVGVRRRRDRDEDTRSFAAVVRAVRSATPAARAVRDPVLVRVGDERQRFGVPRHHRDVALVPAVAWRSRSSSAATCSIVPVLAIGGSHRSQAAVAAVGRNVPDRHGPLFAGLLFSVILILVGLTYFPVLSLGPIVEHLKL